MSATETTVFVYDASSQLVAEYSTTLASTPQVSYLTQDHLGSPRVTTNENAAVTNRKDFAAFGDEVVSAQRVSGNKYASTPDEVRKDYTGYEKDEESGLEFAQARYYNPTHGRFTSVDPMTASATIRDPQTFNRYSYGLNSPYKFTDPLGLAPAGYWQTTSNSSGQCTAQAEVCNDNWGPEEDPLNFRYSYAAGDVQKELKNLKRLYGELTGNDLETVQETLRLAKEIFAEKEIIEEIIKTFRKEGDKTEPLEALNSLNLDGGIKIVGEGENRSVAVIANVFDGRKSGLTVTDPFDGIQKRASVVFTLHSQLFGMKLFLDGRILLGQKAFRGSTITERVENIIHEAVIHKGFDRRDAEFGQSTIEGSQNIHSRLMKILKKSEILKERKE